MVVEGSLACCRHLPIGCDRGAIWSAWASSAHGALSSQPSTRWCDCTSGARRSATAGVFPPRPFSGRRGRRLTAREVAGCAAGSGGRVSTSQPGAGHLSTFVVGDVRSHRMAPPFAWRRSRCSEGMRRATSCALSRRPPEPFRYKDFGTMATIGRGAAVGASSTKVTASGRGSRIFLHLLADRFATASSSATEALRFYPSAVCLITERRPPRDQHAPTPHPRRHFCGLGAALTVSVVTRCRRRCPTGENPPPRRLKPRRPRRFRRRVHDHHRCVEAEADVTSPMENRHRRPSAFRRPMNIIRPAGPAASPWRAIGTVFVDDDPDTR